MRTLARVDFRQHWLWQADESSYVGGINCPLRINNVMRDAPKVRRRVALDSEKIAAKYSPITLPKDDSRTFEVGSETQST